MQKITRNSTVLQGCYSIKKFCCRILTHDNFTTEQIQYSHSARVSQFNPQEEAPSLRRLYGTKTDMGTGGKRLNREQGMRLDNKETLNMGQWMGVAQSKEIICVL